MNEMTKDLSHAAQAIRAAKAEMQRNFQAFDEAIQWAIEASKPIMPEPVNEFGKAVWCDELELEELPLLRDGKATGAFLMDGVTVQIEANEFSDWRVTGFTVLMGGIAGQAPYRLQLSPFDLLFPVLKAAVERSCVDAIEDRMEAYGLPVERSSYAGNDEHCLGKFELLGR